MTDWARHKADQAASSNAPWATGNLRTYQNLMVRWETEAAKLEKSTLPDD